MVFRIREENKKLEERKKEFERNQK